MPELAHFSRICAKIPLYVDVSISLTDHIPIGPSGVTSAPGLHVGSVVYRHLFGYHVRQSHPCVMAI